MVDVTAKSVTERSATACSRVSLSDEVITRLHAGEMPKGDALAVARIAAISATKKMSDLVPLCQALESGHSLVITTGGTGISPTDQTPEFTRSVIDREIPGIAEAIRAHGRGNGVATAALSRGIAGQLANSLVVNLPGSPGGARDGAVVLGAIVIHALEQMAGSDH